MNTNDTFVLNRFGRTLMIAACKSGVPNIKRSFLHRAEYLLSTSIRQDTFNWFAYSTRMSVRRHLALEYISFDIGTAEQLLIEAAHDGYQCFCSKWTSNQSSKQLIFVSIWQNFQKLDQMGRSTLPYIGRVIYLMCLTI